MNKCAPASIYLFIFFFLSKFSAIADSFPGMEMPAVAPQGVSPQPIQLKYVPKWFPKPAGARFCVSTK